MSPFEKASVVSGSLPDLNPMTNPVLGRNLGRWAEVYFTTPVEQREQAVYELLLELQKQEPDETGSADEPSPPSHRQTTDLTADAQQRAVDKDWEEFEMARARLESENRSTRPHDHSPASLPQGSGEVCPVCRHENTPDQWFCGMCGVRLKSEKPRSSVWKKPQHSQEPSPAQVPLRITTASEPESGLHPYTADAPPSWMPEPTLGSWGTPRDALWPVEPQHESGGTAKRIAAIVIVLMLVAGGALLYQRYSSRLLSEKRPAPASVEQSNSPSLPTEPLPVQPEPLPTDSTTSTSELKTSQTEPSAAAPASSTGDAAPSTPEPAIRTPEPATRKTPVAKPEGSSTQEAAFTAPIAADTGVMELAKARELLDGGAGRKNSAQAALWLWKAVSKHNLSAVLTLADLYARGDGVPQNCDQARVLLTAASKRGSAEAAQKLQALQSIGCAQR